MPIPGTKRIKYLDENMGAAQVELTSKELQNIADMLPAGSTSGQRYHEQGMKAVNL